MYVGFFFNLGLFALGEDGKKKKKAVHLKKH